METSRRGPGATRLRAGQRILGAGTTVGHESGIAVIEQQEKLTKQVDTHPYPLLFATISGAHLYGFPSEDSDFDLYGETRSHSQNDTTTAEETVFSHSLNTLSSPEEQEEGEEGEVPAPVVAPLSIWDSCSIPEHCDPANCQ